MPRLAFFHSTFPTLSGTFSQQQMREARAQGLDFISVSNRAPGPGEYHPADEDFHRETFRLTPVRPGAYLKANLGRLLRSPGRYLAAVGLALRLGDDYPWQRLRNLAQLAGAAVLADHLDRHDASHVCVHFAFGAASLAVFLNRLSGISYAVVVHGSDVLLPQPIMAAKLGRADFVVSNCRYHVDNLRAKYPLLQDKPFYIVRGGLELDSDQWRPAGPPADGLPLRILHVSRLHPVKAQDVLIKALAGLKAQGVNFHCRLVGDGPLMGELTALADSLGLGSSVEFMGARFSAEVAELYGWSQVVVLSSKSEGTPMTIIEAMAKGRAVVAPAITAIPEMIEHGISGLLYTPGQTEDLTAQLARLAAEPGLIGSMGAAGRARAEEMYSLRANVQRLLAIFGQQWPDLNLNQGVKVHHE